MESELLTTGQAARILGVTSDAVLKWIKKGRVPAVRTAGGHFRVSRADIEALGGPGLSHAARSGQTTPSQTTSAPKRCWEFFCHDGAVADSCKRCVVYRAGIEKCYEVAELGPAIGHSLQFCRGACQDCSFFRAYMGLAPAALVVTDDEQLIGSLTSQSETGGVVLHFARCGYECSMLVETFQPLAVVLDSSLPELREGCLLDSMLQDQRMRGARILVAQRQGDRIVPNPGATVIPLPFTVEDIERFMPEITPTAVSTRHAAS